MCGTKLHPKQLTHYPTDGYDSSGGISFDTGSLPLRYKSTPDLGRSGVGHRLRFYMRPLSVSSTSTVESAFADLAATSR